MNLGNSIVVVKDSVAGELRGIGVELARALAARLGVPATLVEYRNAGAIVDSARTGAWDIAFLAVDPARGDVEFTPAYMEVENGYLVPTASAIRTNADIDRPGIRVAVPGRSAPDLFLARTLKHATLVRGDTEMAAFSIFRSGEADVIAAARHSFAMFLDGGQYRALDKSLLLVPHAIAVPRGRRAALETAKAFVEEAKASGDIARAIVRANLRGVRLAASADVK
jgi:polar amino acid transport system substrate-binding protein